jgi:hypothetical protein
MYLYMQAIIFMQDSIIQPRNFLYRTETFLCIIYLIEKVSFMTSQYSIYLFYIFIVV